MTKEEKAFVKKVVRTIRTSKEVGVILTIKDNKDNKRHAYIGRYEDGHVYGICWRGANSPIALISKRGRKWEITYDPDPNKEDEIVTVNLSNL